MRDQNVFAGAYVDRAGERRKDERWLESAFDDATSIFLPVHNDRCLIDGSACVLLAPDRAKKFAKPDELIFLGLYHERPTFAFVADDAQPFEALGEFADLRFIGTELPADEANLAAHARALVFWHSSHQYCGRCGSPALFDQAGNARRCSNEECAQSLFPRVDPAVIVLVSRGDRCLLGRAATWPAALYSTVAGFVEPGESLEDAVRREVFEETNVLVGNVRYHSSQPWPFPSSLMLGFHAEGLSDDIRLNDKELEDARWFSRDELHSDFPRLPAHVSIARRLVDHWLNEGE
jgi:NAD+ diphosphatase